MRITAITAQKKNKNRLNVMVEGSYRFSIDMFQYADLGIRVDKDYSEAELNAFEQESQFGKLYARALEYCLMRHHSAKEVRDYLYRKTLETMTKDGDKRPGVPIELTQRVFDRLEEKKYINDERFAQLWVENRKQTTGISQRKLMSELASKGVDRRIIESVISSSVRDENEDLHKVIEKKQRRYQDDQKFIQYLMRQGFHYDDIKRALHQESDI